MIYFIDVLKKEYSEKNIFVFDTGKRAIWLLSHLLYRGITISGFVTYRKEYESGMILGKPVIMLQDFMEMQDAVLVYDDEVDGLTKNKLKESGKGFLMQEILELNPALSQGSHYIYGTGAGAMKYLKALSCATGTIRGFLETKKPEQTSIAGIPCYEFTDAPFGPDDSIIISTVDYETTCQILDYMQENGYTGDVFIREIDSPLFWWIRNPFTMLDIAMKKNKQVFLCCGDPISREWLRMIFRIIGLEADQEVESIDQLTDTDPDNSLLFLHALTDSKRFKMVMSARAMGYSETKGNFASIHYMDYAEPYMNGQIAYEKDETLGLSIDYSRFGGKPGWAVFGNEEAESVKLMILGESNTTGLFYPESWVSKLFKKIQAQNILLTIYNGAQERADIAKEMRRMMRDIDYLKPDIVISFGGGNNLGIPEDSFDRLRQENAFAYWKRTERQLQTLAKLSGAVPYSVLQPLNMCMADMSLEEGMFFAHQAYTTRYVEMLLQESREGDHYLNLIDLFHHQKDMFFDCAHYTEEANEIIAEKVFDLVIEKVRTIYQEKIK